MWSFSHETIYDWLRGGANKMLKSCIFLCIDNLQSWNICSLRGLPYRKRKNSYGNLLHFSIEYKNQELFNKLLQKCYEYNIDLNGICYKNGDTILHSAVRYNVIHYLHINCLYEPFLCFVNNKNNDGETPLHIACYYKNKKVIKHLLSYFPYFDIRNDPLEYSIINLNYEIVEFLLENYSYYFSEFEFRAYLRLTNCEKMTNLIESYKYFF